jgi:hypothetical protein
MRAMALEFLGQPVASRHVVVLIGVVMKGVRSWCVVCDMVADFGAPVTSRRVSSCCV